MNDEQLEACNDDFASAPPPAPEPTHTERAVTLIGEMAVRNATVRIVGEARALFGAS